jgi:hypothetical protein
MISAAFWVVAITGCGDAGGACTDARLLPTRYATAAACRAALPQRIVENTDVPWPEIGGECRPQEVKVAKVEGPKRG